MLLIFSNVLVFHHASKPYATHVNTKGQLSSTSDSPYVNPTLCCSLASAFQYVIFTHSNISYVVQQVCLHMYAPTYAHLLALKRNPCYIQGTKLFDIHLPRLLLIHLSLTLMLTEPVI